MSITVSSLSSSAAFLRFRQPFITEGSNQQRLGLGAGVVQGGNLVSSGAADTSVVILADTLSGKSVFVYESTVGGSRHAVTVLLEGNKTVPLVGAVGVAAEVFIALHVDYTTTAPTTVEIRTYTVAELAAAPEGPDVVILGTVDLSGTLSGHGVYSAGETIDADDVILTGRREAWLSGGIRSWTNVVLNGDFHLKGSSVPVRFTGVQEIAPGFQVEVPSGSAVSTIGAFPIGLDPAWSVALAAGSSVVTLEPKHAVDGTGNPPAVFDCRPGQALHVGFFVTPEAFTVGTTDVDLEISWWDATGSTIAATNNKATVQITSGTADQTFVRVDEVVEAPTGAARFSWQLKLTTAAQDGAGIIWVDKVFVYVDKDSLSDALQAQIAFDARPIRTSSVALVPVGPDLDAAHQFTVVVDNEHKIDGGETGAFIVERQQNGALFDKFSEANLRHKGFFKQGTNYAIGVDWLEAFGDSAGTLGGELATGAVVGLLPGDLPAPSAAGTLTDGNFTGLRDGITARSKVFTDPSGADITLAGVLSFDQVDFGQAAGQLTSKFVVAADHLTIRDSNIESGVFELQSGQVVWENCTVSGNLSENFFGVNLNNFNSGTPLNARFTNCFFAQSNAPVASLAAMHILELAAAGSTILFENCTFASTHTFGTAATVLVQNSNNGATVQFINCQASAVNHTCVKIGVNGGGTLRNVSLQNFQITNTGDNGFEIGGSTSKIMLDNVHVACTTPAASHAFNLSNNSSVSDVKVTNSSFSTTGNGDVWGFVTSTVSSCDRIEFDNCFIEGQGGQVLKVTEFDGLFNHCKFGSGAVNDATGKQFLSCDANSDSVRHALRFRDCTMSLGASNHADAGVGSGEPILFFGGVGGTVTPNHGPIFVDGLHITTNGVDLHKDSLICIDGRSAAIGMPQSVYLNMTVDIQGSAIPSTGSGRGTLSGPAGGLAQMGFGNNAAIIEIDGGDLSIATGELGEAFPPDGGDGTFVPRLKFENLSILRVKGAAGAGTIVHNVISACHADFDGLTIDGEQSATNDPGAFTNGPVLTFRDTSVRNLSLFPDSAFNWGGTGNQGVIMPYSGTYWQGKVHRTVNHPSLANPTTLTAFLVFDGFVYDGETDRREITFDRFDIQIGSPGYDATSYANNYTDVVRFLTDSANDSKWYKLVIQDCNWFAHDGQLWNCSVGSNDARFFETRIERNEFRFTTRDGAAAGSTFLWVSGTQMLRSWITRNIFRCLAGPGNGAVSWFFLGVMQDVEVVGNKWQGTDADAGGASNGVRFGTPSTQLQDIIVVSNNTIDVVQEAFLGIYTDNGNTSRIESNLIFGGSTTELEVRGDANIVQNNVVDDSSGAGVLDVTGTQLVDTNFVAP